MKIDKISNFILLRDIGYAGVWLGLSFMLANIHGLSDFVSSLLSRLEWFGSFGTWSAIKILTVL